LAVLAECGRYPLHVNYFTKYIKVWLKIISMNDNRLVKQCYLMDYNLREMGRITFIKLIIMFGRTKELVMNHYLCLNLSNVLKIIVFSNGLNLLTKIVNYRFLGISKVK